MSLPKQVSLFSQTLPCRADGLKALVYSTDYGRRVEAVLWKESADLETTTPVVLQGMPQVNGAAAGFIEDALVVCDYEAGAGLRLCEYVITPETTWNPRFTTIFGNPDSNAPAVLKLRSGGFVVLGYRNDSTFTIDTAYRRPTIPPAPGEGALPSQWALHTFFIVPGPVGIVPHSLALVEGPDGLIYLFATRDSSHTIKLLRLRVENGELVQVDYNDSFISESSSGGVLLDGEMAIDGEFPFVAAATDWQNGRILITYNQSRWIWSRDSCETIQTRPVVVAVKPDLSKTLVATIPDPVNRSLTRSPIIILPSGVYVVYCYITEADCLDWQWRLARVSGKGASIFNMAPSDYTAACALSPDGWMVYKDRANTLVNVDQLPLLRSKRDGNNLTLTWPGAGQLEFSKDKQTWEPSPFTSPATVAIGNEQVFFRVRYGS